MAERNLIVEGLPEASKMEYSTLMDGLNKDEQKGLEKQVKAMKSSADLAEWIKTETQSRDLLKLLPKPERSIFKAEHIADCFKQFDLIIQAAMFTRQSYIDLLEVLPDDEATDLKDKIVRATTLPELDQIVASSLPKSLMKCDDPVKEGFLKLPDDQRLTILKTAMHQNSGKDGLNMEPEAVADKTAVNPATLLPPSYEQDANTQSIAKPDIHKLIAQAVKVQEAKMEEDVIPQDSWGAKLPLTGELRRQFLNTITSFSQSDKDYLKELFYKADADSIENFFSVYFTGFNKDDRIMLLGTLIYLYKLNSALTLKLCNDPTSVSQWDRLKLFCRTSSSQINLLAKLDKELQNL